MTDLPYINDQCYKDITEQEFEWLREHLQCHVQLSSDDWDGMYGSGLVCQSHNLKYNRTLDSINLDDDSEERLV